MRETEAVCAAIRDELPKRHSDLMADVVSVTRWGNSKAYEVKTATGQTVVVKAMPEPEPHESPEAYSRWRAGYAKDQWILQNVHAAVPVPTILAIGNEPLLIRDLDEVAGTCNYAYMILSRLPHEPSPVRKGLKWDWETGKMALGPEFTEHNQGEALLAQIGAMAHTIHQTETQGYGGGWYTRRVDFHVEIERFDFASWPEMVDHLVANSALDTMVAEGILSTAQRERLETRITRLKQLDAAPRLFHGDLVCNLSNLLVDPSQGHITGVVDWESSGSGPTPYYEFALALRTWYRDGWDETQIQRNFQALLHGYGCSEAEYQERYHYDTETILGLLALDLLHLALPKDDKTLKDWGWIGVKPSMKKIIWHVTQ